jgi:hypothetical protein
MSTGARINYNDFQELDKAVVEAARTRIRAYYERGFGWPPTLRYSIPMNNDNPFNLKFRPTQDRVLCLEIPAKDEVQGLILIPAGMKDEVILYEVVRVGKTITPYQPKQTVIAAKYGGTDIE